MTATNDTHDPDLQSWVESANRDGTDFPIQNLPYGVISPKGQDDDRIAVAIGDRALDLRAACRAGLLEGPGEALEAPILNPLMAQTPGTWSALRRRLSHALRAGAPGQEALSACLIPMDEVDLKLPARIGDFTDFYCSIEHATNAGRLSRPDNPLMPNFTSLPVAYNGRASSVVVSGTPVTRPHGQYSQGGDIVFAPTEMLDFELEVGVFIGGGNPQFRPIPLSKAPDHFFGICLLNDWSARDIQSWEYRPLGPFLAKAFATGISGWIVTQEALAPFRKPARERGTGDGKLLAYLDEPENRARGGIGLDLQVRLQSDRMRRKEQPPETICTTGFDAMFWTIPQMIAHHASGGCPLRPGDLFGSGTVSKHGEKAQGCLLEATMRGVRPITLANGESRGFLEDGDEVTMTGRCTAPGARSIGLGECRGRVVPAAPWLATQ